MTDKQTIISAMISIREQSGNDSDVLESMASAMGNPEDAKELADLIRAKSEEIPMQIKPVMPQIKSMS